MSTWIALLRGINVGGHNTIRMAALRSLLGSLGLENVETYIQSGNVVFDAPERKPADLGEEIADEIEKSHGFRPRVFVMTADHLREAMDANPYPQAVKDPKTVHLFFLASPPSDPDLEKIGEVTSATERSHLTDDVFYLHAPDGIGRSKLAGNAGRYLGVDVTARNWRTLEKISEIVDRR